MTTQTANRAQDARKRLDETLGMGDGYPFSRITTVKIAKGQPRGIKIEWGFYPPEAEVINALGDLYDPENTILSRFTVWACGQVHDDERDAWMAHEGQDHTEYVHDDGCSFCASDEKHLPYETEQELIAQGETFESWCTPGNFAPCPGCSGHGDVLNGDRANPGFKACEVCDRRATLNLDDRTDFALYKSAVETVREEIRQRLAKEKASRERARRRAARVAKGPKPGWTALPAREDGTIDGYPVRPTFDCDYLSLAESPSARTKCANDAAWFDPATGLRLCTQHKKAGPSRLP